MGEIEKAQLIFLDAIERRSAAVAAAVSNQPEAVQKIFSEQIDRLSNVIKQAILSIPKPRDAKDPESIAPLVEAVSHLCNLEVISLNKIMDELNRLSQKMDVMVAELKRIERPLKWKLVIDRNYTTREIQGAEMVAEV